MCIDYYYMTKIVILICIDSSMIIHVKKFYHFNVYLNSLGELESHVMCKLFLIISFFINI